MEFALYELEMLRSGLGAHESEFNFGNGDPYWPAAMALYERIDAEIVRRGGKSEPSHWMPDEICEQENAGEQEEGA